MADGTTTNYSFILPQVGASDDSWGTKNNANWSALDTVLLAKMDKAGGHFTNAIIMDTVGTAAAPQIRVGNSAGTGLYGDQTDGLQVAFAGTRVAQFNATGINAILHAIASVSPFNTLFKIVPVEVDANNGGADVYTLAGGTLAFKVRIDKDGKVGINTNAPAAKLHVNGNSCMNLVTQANNAATIDCTAGNAFKETISATTTFAFQSPPSGVFYGFLLQLTNGGSATVNWPATVKWSNGTVPSLTASGVDTLFFYTVDGGTTWYGKLTDQASA